MGKNALNGVLFFQKCIVVNDKAQILALKRSRSKDHGGRSEAWDLPGGTYELGEDVIDSIKREVKEETNLLIIDPRPIYVASGQNFQSEFMSGENVFAVTYVCRDWEGLPAEASAKEGEVKISDKHTEFRWVTPEEFMSFDFGDDGGFFVSSMKAYTTLLR
ncbi:MAG: NUDIX domain-containing protein [bacterium]